MRACAGVHVSAQVERSRGGPAGGRGAGCLCARDTRVWHGGGPGPEPLEGRAALEGGQEASVLSPFSFPAPAQGASACLAFGILTKYPHCYPHTAGSRLNGPSQTLISTPTSPFPQPPAQQCPLSLESLHLSWNLTSQTGRAWEPHLLHPPPNYLPSRASFKGALGLGKCPSHL